MTFFIRFSNNIEGDIERGTSIITCDKNGVDIEPVIVDGLCAFGYYESIADCHEAAQKKALFFETKNYAILHGIRNNTIEGSIGCVITDVSLVSKHSL